MIDALVVGHERVADGSLANVSNDACGDVLVGHFAPCGSQIGFGEPCFVQFQYQFTQLLAGEFARTGEYGHQCRNVVAVALDEGGKLLNVVFRFVCLAIAALGGKDFVFVIRDEHRCCGAFTFAIQNFTEIRILREPGCHLIDGHGFQFLDEVLRGHTRFGFKVTGGFFGEVAFFALQFG